MQLHFSTKVKYSLSKAGIIGHRLYLASNYLNIGCSGIGLIMMTMFAACRDVFLSLGDVFLILKAFFISFWFYIPYKLILSIILPISLWGGSNCHIDGALRNNQHHDGQADSGSCRSQWARKTQNLPGGVAQILCVKKRWNWNWPPAASAQSTSATPARFCRCCLSRFV